MSQADSRTCEHHCQFKSMKNIRVTASWNLALKFLNIPEARPCGAGSDSLQERLSGPLHKVVRFVTIRTSDAGDAKNIEWSSQRAAGID